MASIIKRKSGYSVVYRYTDDEGKTHQKWESFPTNAEAKKRKAQIELEQFSGTFVVPTCNTVHDLLEVYVSIYGVNNWAMSTYRGKQSLINNYINPYIGDLRLDKVTTLVLEKYYQDLLKVKSTASNNRKPTREFVGPSTVREIHKILRNAFEKAIKWEMMGKNPAINATTPKETPKEREIWDVETFHKALEVCDDDFLALAMNLAFSCTLRMGEMLGITLDCVDVSDTSIAAGRASIYINKGLQRVNIDALEKLDNKDVLFKFPRVLSANNTVLVLKTPKTKTSKRRVYLPNTVAQMVRKRIEELEEIKTLLGDEYCDYNLLFASSTGRPVEGAQINRAFSKLIQENNLPPVVFHSIRHSSITYKLKWTEGDIKAVQGDSGHARADMVANTYSHILDEDRASNAQLFDRKFYGELANDQEGKVVEMPKAHATEAQSSADAASTSELQAALAKVFLNPEMGKALRAVLSQQSAS